jgi:hypothetical protein
MADKQTAARAAGCRRINVNEDYEVQYWTQELGVTKGRLQELVREHGVSIGSICDEQRERLDGEQHCDGTKRQPSPSVL